MPTGVNPLVDAALPLLSLGGQLRHTAHPPDIPALRNQVGRAIKNFELEARTNGADQKMTMMARYAICTFIDEMVMCTPWGAECGWSQSSMLIVFHKEAWGGEKFFTLIDGLLANPAQNIDLLELLYVCICLGFEGKYRVLDRGRVQLETVEDTVYQVIARHRGDFERELSPHWRGLEDRRSALTRYVPLWVIGAFAAAIAIALYVTFTFTLTRNADPVFARIMKIVPGPVPSYAPPPPVIVETGCVSEFLADEIARGLVEVNEYDDRAVVRIKGDGLFASGSIVPRTTVLPLLARIAEAVDRETGDVLVTGHTDNVPIRTLKFPSNWHLSQARAEAVAERLAADLPAGSGKAISAEGRADTEPVAPNDNAVNRALNRRVEIVVRGRCKNERALSAGA